MDSGLFTLSAMCRQIGYQRRLLRATRDGSGVMHHVVQSDFSCVRMTQNDHAQRIPNQQKIETQFIKQSRHGVVISGQRCKLPRIPFPGNERLRQILLFYRKRINI